MKSLLSIYNMKIQKQQVHNIINSENLKRAFEMNQHINTEINICKKKKIKIIN